METATLVVSSLALVTSVATLLVMVKTAKELQAAKTEVDNTVAEVKEKVNHNAKVVKSALGALEF